MIIATVKLKGRKEKRIEIIQTISEISEQVRQSKGCRWVDCYHDINNKHIYYLVKAWRTHQDLDLYLGSRLFAVLLGIKSLLVEKPEIKILVEDCSYSTGAGRENVQVH